MEWAVFGILIIYCIISYRQGYNHGYKDRKGEE